MTTCPVCSKPVDPIRSRFVAVRDGKIVPYCSPECRDAQASKPTQQPPELRPKTPAVGIPTSAPRSIADLDSGPVIEIIHEPQSGVVTSAKDERQPTGKVAKAEIGGAVTTVVETSKPRPDGSKGSGGKDSAQVSGEVNAPSDVKIEATKRARTRPSGKHLTRERRDSTEAKAGWDWLDDEPAEHARPGTFTQSERRGRWPLLLALVLAVGAGGALLAWKLVGEKARPVAAPPGPASGVVVVDAPAADAAPAVTKESAVRAARKILLDAITSGTERVQRLAAPALGRTGDPAAVAALQKAVKQERVPAARFKLAYALARARDAGGREALVAGLALPDRSDKLDAATHLARLGDPRAKPLLQSLLGLGQHKLRAAEELARFKDPEAEKLLAQIRSDAGSSADEKATATIALYRTGKTELAEDVRELLQDKSWRTPAAYALAEVGKDPGVRAELVEQATHGIGVKVRAAYALRKLAGDATEEMLPDLVAALASQKDQEQFYAAEAILILAGDPQWAELE